MPLPTTRALALVPFASVDAALRSVHDLLSSGPSAVELMDRELIDPANRPPAVRALLGGVIDAQALLMVEYSGEDDEVARRLAALGGEAQRFRSVEEQAAVWAVRRTGIARALKGVAGPGDPRPVAFIEDPAVPPQRLADFAAAVRALLHEEGVPAVWYGHASVGCLHIRPLMDLRLPGMVPRLRRITEAVAELVGAAGGSLSGEHGDGRLRSELLGRMYPPETIAAFATLKRLVDPHGLLNPGILTDPEPLDAGLRLAASPPRRPHRTAISFAAEGGLARASEACNGNGACRADVGAMCPSYQALGDERHSTRGRAVLLRSALEGRLEGGLANRELHEALELCLGCKACAAECPAQVDMARFKVEALAHRWAHGRVPLSVRALAETHRLLALGARAPRLSAALAVLAGRVGGGRPPAPVAPWRPPTAEGDGPRVAVLADTFTRFLEPSVGDAAVRVLRAAGARVEVVVPGCCGRPLLSQGFVERARRTAASTIARLAPLAAAGVPIVVLEPSCWSMLFDDAPRLMTDAADARAVAGALTSVEAALEQLGAGDRFRSSDAAGRTVVHRHCHARSLGGDGGAPTLGGLSGGGCADSDAGCCGMAGGFGYRHPELARMIGEHRFAPAARGANALVAAGYSCREQARRMTGRSALHPAEYLATLLA
ncbi:MAG TPA: FAD-linked oxidase C-terminal domain-containing protein [Miltoncostaeaceae bacterium]|nr:FAD-linked oxidase C-terminal domain-containing protein [Miltoncostaeaceae bacterium]